MHPNPDIDTDKTCALRRQLAAKFAICARLYAETVVLLAGDISVMSKEKYQQVRESAEDARRDMESARIAFEEHLQMHQCEQWAEDY